jgi:arsenate reductase-like glutaredoxin family protein
MTASPPRLPKITLWWDPTCVRCDRAHSLLTLVGCEVETRDLAKSPPTERELRALAASIARGPGRKAGAPPADPREFVRSGRRRTSTGDALFAEMAADSDLVERPIAIVLDRKTAVVARPAELALSLLMPEAPEGKTPGDLVRAAVQGRAS